MLATEAEINEADACFIVVKEQLELKQYDLVDKALMCLQKKCGPLDMRDLKVKETVDGMAFIIKKVNRT